MESLVDVVHDVDSVLLFLINGMELVLISFNLGGHFIRRSKVNILRLRKHLPRS